MAIEIVEISDNKGVMQDEVLSHRLGLIPIKADARMFDYPPPLGFFSLLFFLTF